MKKIISIFGVVFSMLMTTIVVPTVTTVAPVVVVSMLPTSSVSAQLPTVAQSQGDYAGYLGVKDTLTDVDTTVYEILVTGKKHNISFQCNVIKLTGTVAGKFDLYGSVDGVTYETAPITSVTKTDATANYVIKLSYNGYAKYKVASISSGTNTHSQRVFGRWRGIK